jgi:thioredoxin reductase (NADPH)
MRREGAKARRKTRRIQFRIFFFASSFALSRLRGAFVYNDFVKSPTATIIRHMREKIVIIGSGPAGWTCAIYAARANLNPLIYEGSFAYDMAPMGQLALTSEVENFPGFPHGILGPDLMLAMRQQAEHVGARIVTEVITDVDLSKRPFKLTDSTGAVIEAESVVICTGASANYLGLESEERFKNHGVSACAVCDGALPRFRNQPVVVVGGGDSACEEATHLSKFASTVYLVYRKERAAMPASNIMANRILANPKVKPVWNSAVEEVLGDSANGMTGVRVKNSKTGETQTIEARGLFVAIGHTPNTKFLRGQVKTNKEGFIELVDRAHTLTSVEGVFAAGDVADPFFKQAITAAGMGCKAALDAERWLETQESPAEPAMAK